MALFQSGQLTTSRRSQPIWWQTNLSFMRSIRKLWLGMRIQVLCNLKPWLHLWLCSRLSPALHWNPGQDSLYEWVLQNVDQVERLKDWHCLQQQSGHDYQRVSHFQLFIIPSVSRGKPRSLAWAGNITSSWQCPNHNLQEYSMLEKKNQFMIVYFQLTG